ncbi:MAG: hypothetical protein FJ087_08020 [Deltaproteobacteria bacterium]|nr:hypothetical protein [Deltaproteobacteria bacterium]
MDGVLQLLPFEVLAPVGQLSPEEGEVLVRLSLHRGRAEAIGLAELARLTDLEPRRVQQVVKHLVELHQVPIGTATRRPCGYYIIESDRERRETRDSHVRRALSTLRRARAYDKGGWVYELVGQVEMRLAPEERRS